MRSLGHLIVMREGSSCRSRPWPALAEALSADPVEARVRVIVEDEGAVS